MDNQPKPHSSPEKLHIKHNSGTNEPNDHREQHRVEVVASLFLAVWVLADILIDYGHPRVATWAFYTALAIPLWLLAYHTKRGLPSWVRFGKWFFIFVVIALAVWVRAMTLLASFSVVAQTVIRGADQRAKAPNVNGCLFWCVHTRTVMNANNVNIGTNEVSPVLMAWYVKLTNERDSRIFVDGFSVEARTPKGNWERVPIFDVHPEYGQVTFYIVQSDLKHAAKVDFGDNFLQTKLAENPLDPNKPVFGWLMLDMPKDGWGRDFRFIATSGEDRIVVKSVKMGREGLEKDKNDMDIKTANQTGWHRGTGVEEDLSGLPVRYYGDGMNLVTGKID